MVNLMSEHISKLIYIDSVMMVRSRTLIMTLLLRSGDVELNPGPMTEEDLERVDNTQILGERDFHHLYNELVTIKTNYYQLGIGLGLPPGELQAIQRGAQHADQGLAEVLLAWLRNVGCFVRPTWRGLVKAVDSPAGGNNPALAMAIAVKHSIAAGTATSVSHPSNHPLPQQLVQQPLHSVMAAPPSGPGSSSAAGSFMFCPPSGYLGLPSQPGHRYNYVAHQAQPQPCFDPSMQHYWRSITAPSPKRQKLTASIQTSQHEQLSTGPSQNYKRWCELLANSYLVDDSLSLAWPPLRTSQFVQLSLVRQNNGARHVDLKTVYGKIDEVYGDKTNVAIKDIFDNVEYRSLILFEGRPGSGKTTLMIKISHDWAKGELLQSKLVLLVQLRRLYGKEDIYLSDLFHVACSTLSPEDIRGLTAYIEGTLGKDVVFLLDGFDEYTPGSNEDSFIYKLIAKQFFSESIVIVSSRPAATQPFRQNAARWIEVVGFMEKEIIEYIYSYYGDSQRKAETLSKHLKQHPNLMNLCYLPLHCAMLVFLYEEDMILPKTETQFYRDFTLSTLVRSNCKKFGKVPLNILTFNDLPHDEKVIFYKICRLAFEATVTSKQVFKYSELQSIHFDDANEESDMNSLGLVVIDRYFVKFGLDKTYTFLHLTLQEYLSSVYIAGLGATEQEAIINEHGNKQNLFVTWRFLFGTLDYSKDATTNLFKLMMDATHGVVNSCNLSIQCAFESQNDLACSHVIDFYKNKLTFSELSLTSTDVASIVHLLKCSKCTEVHLSFEKCMLSEDDATALLQGIGDRQLSLTLLGDWKNSQLIHCVPMLNALNVVSAVSAPNLVQLEVYCCRQSNSEEILEFPNLKNIATLQALKFNRVAKIVGLEDCFQHWPKLKEVYFETWFETDGYVEAVIKELKHCPELEKVTFVSVRECTGLKECFQHWPKLKELYLRDYICDVTYAEAVIKELKFCCQLQRLTFCGAEVECCLDESTCRVLGETLQYLPKLQHINLYFNVRIDDLAVTHLAKGLTHCVHLEELDLGGCNTISDSGATHLAEGLAHCPHLKELNLWLCIIGDTGVKVLLESLMMNCKGIRELNLDDNNLTNKSIPSLMEFVESSRNLEKLVLVEAYSNPIEFTERGWSKLVETVEQRNSTEGMTQLELVGRPIVESDDESGDDSEQNKTTVC